MMPTWRNRELEGTSPHEGEPLTPREEEVMHARESGETRDASARRLHIAYSTINKHIVSAIAKLAPGRGLFGAAHEHGKREQRAADEGSDMAVDEEYGQREAE